MGLCGSRCFLLRELFRGSVFLLQIIQGGQIPAGMKRGADDSDVFRDGFVAAEEFKIHGAVGPPGAEFLAHASVVGPAGISVRVGLLGRDFDGDGGRAEDIAVPIHNAACGAGVDGDLDGGNDSLRGPCNGLWLGAGAGA